MNLMTHSIVPLTVSDVPLQVAGGKGKSLAKLLAAGLPVPPGFIISTDAYIELVAINKLKEPIIEIVSKVASQLLTADEAEASIRSLFAAAEIPIATTNSIKRAYAELAQGELAVAVRSSATAEDLPNLSFAGQQDTYLNVCGETAFFEALRNCWASLWTARAISYRERMQIDHRDVAMAVVVQTMVQSDIAGILFTANPATGDRSEIVITASFGLGEAVVGGHVTPDTYILNHEDLTTKQVIIGAKEKMIVSLANQGTDVQAVAADKRGESSLSDELLVKLAALALDAEQLFEAVPQDIEWAVSNGNCYLLQSRPITGLPASALAEVKWNPPREGMKLVRRQVVENMPEPLSPLFEDIYLEAGFDQSIDELLGKLGVPVDIDDFIERPMFRTVNGYAYSIASYKFGWQMFSKIPKVLFWYVTSLSKMLKNMIPMWRDEGLPNYLKTIDQWKAMDLSASADAKLLSGIRALATADAVYWFYISIVMGMAKVTDGMLHYFLSSRLVSGELTSGMFLRGFPSKTLEAQAELEAIATRVNAVADLNKMVIETPAVQLMDELRRHGDGDSLLQDIQQYLDRYGHQIYNLDFIQPTQVENPLPVLLSLKTLVQNPDYDTGLLQAEMAKERASLVLATLESLGPVRRWLFRKLLGWAQATGPNREEALFYMGAAWPTLRSFALELGGRLVNAGTIVQPEDIFYLTGEELAEAISARDDGNALLEFAQLVASRRELRESRKKLHPPAMVPEKSRFKFGPFDLSAWETQKRNKADSNTLNGFAVSPGTITGAASVILSPSDFEKMEPNTILVCATTTPAWTPLFSQASGLVTDIGGMLAHGSIVAREYGIPAVMGTGNITQRIVSGQQILVDGNRGIVTILGSKGTE